MKNMAKEKRNDGRLVKNTQNMKNRITEAESRNFVTYCTKKFSMLSHNIIELKPDNQFYISRSSKGKVKYINCLIKHDAFILIQQVSAFYMFCILTTIANLCTWALCIQIYYRLPHFIWSLAIRSHRTCYYALSPKRRNRNGWVNESE